jgi:multimeric flavodoxin WrbA
VTDAPYILAIAGSPRRHGNSEVLLDAFIEGATEAGVRVEKLIVADHSIEACRGCNACSLTGECVIRDEMHDVYRLVDEAAALVVATPVFFAGVPAVLKAVFDRFQPYWARRFVLKDLEPARRPAGIIMVGGGGDPYGFEGAMWTTKSVYSVLGFDSIDQVELAGVDSPGDLGRFPEVVEAARELGARLAREVSA